MKVKVCYVGLIDNREKTADVSACKCSAVRSFQEWIVYVVRNISPLGNPSDKVILEA